MANYWQRCLWVSNISIWQGEIPRSSQYQHFMEKPFWYHLSGKVYYWVPIVFPNDFHWKLFFMQENLKIKLCYLWFVFFLKYLYNYSNIILCMVFCVVDFDKWKKQFLIFWAFSLLWKGYQTLAHDKRLPLYY